MERSAESSAETEERDGPRFEGQIVFKGNYTSSDDEGSWLAKLRI